MTQPKRSKYVDVFLELLKSEWKQSAYRKHPDQTILALQDERVVAALEKRFTDQIALKDVRQLDFDPNTGLLNIVFEFGPNTASLLPTSSDAFLAILDANGKLVGLVDPFDDVQPNAFFPPLPQPSEHPFVLDRPTADMKLGDDGLDQLRWRAHSYFDQLRIKSGGRIIIDDTVDTMCYYTTRVPGGYITDRTVDDSFPVIWV